MSPDNRPAKGFIGRLQQMSAADLFVFLRSEAGDDQVARLAEQKIPIAVLRQKRGPVRFAAVAAGGRLERLP